MLDRHRRLIPLLGALGCTPSVPADSAAPACFDEPPEAATPLPLLHIADPTGEAIRHAGFRRVGLLGSRFTMEQDFYRARLRDRHGLEALVPGPEDRERVHRVIYDELCLGEIRPESRAVYSRVMADLVARGAEGIVLGCTEIALLVGPADATVPLFDTTALHARAAAERALAVP